MSRNKKKIIRAATVSLSCVFFEDIMRKMRGMGYEMVALTSPGPQLDALKEEGFHCIEVPMERHISLFKDLKSLFRLIAVLRKEKPYMIHSMTPKAGMLCMLAGWLAGVPLRIHTFTGLVWPTTAGVKRRILMATDWLTCTCATHVIPEGQGVMNDLRSGRITRKPMKVLGYGNVKGVDMEVFRKDISDASEADKASTACEGQKNGLFTFVFVGRVVEKKGVNELVEAFTKLNEKYPNTRLRLVGWPEQELDPVLPITLQRIQMSDAIEACGPKYGNDLLQEYASADCFVMPSYREGFPNTVLEAGAMGLPCIVTDINGSREIIVEGKNGTIIPPQDSQRLYEAMERMMTDDEARKEMARNARPMIESRFEKNFVQSKLMEFYEEIMK